MQPKETETRTERTRRQNDEMRELILTGSVEAYGTIAVTLGVANRGELFVRKAAEAVAGFEAFDVNNDSHLEHDFGAFTINGELLFFKIGYFNSDLSAHSPDKSSMAVTHRVLTIMLSSEY